MNEFIEKFKTGLVVKVDRENIKNFLEIIQYNSDIHWASTRSPIDFNPSLRNAQEEYFYIFYKKELNGMQVTYNPKRAGKEIYDFQNFKLDSKKQVVFRKSIMDFLTKEHQQGISMNG